MEAAANQLVIVISFHPHPELDANPLSMDDSPHGTLGPIKQQRMAIHLTVIGPHMEMDANPLVVPSGIQHVIRGPTAQQHAAILLTETAPHLRAPVEITISHAQAPSRAANHLEPLCEVIAVLMQTILLHVENLDV